MVEGAPCARRCLTKVSCSLSLHSQGCSCRVIHLPFGADAGLANVAVAADAGADGVFLINQGMGVAIALT